MPLPEPGCFSLLRRLCRMSFFLSMIVIIIAMVIDRTVGTIRYAGTRLSELNDDMGVTGRRQGPSAVIKATVGITVTAGAMTIGGEIDGRQIAGEGLPPFH